MDGIEIQDCGTCAGCRAKAEVAALIAEYDRVCYTRQVVPVYQAMERTKERRIRWPANGGRDPEMAALRAQLRMHQEQRAQYVSALAKSHGALMGCYNFTIVIGPREAAR